MMIDDQNCNLIIGEIRRVNGEVRGLDNDIKMVNEKLAKIQVEIATLRVRVAFWGSVAGIFGAVLTQGVLSKLF